MQHIYCSPSWSNRGDRSSAACRECVLAEIEEAIAEERQELKRGDVFELGQEWLRLEDDR